MTIAEPFCARVPGNLERTKEPVYTGMPTTNLVDTGGNEPESKRNILPFSEEPFLGPEPYLTLREIAERFHCKERTVREWTERYDDFPGIRLPGEWRVRVSDFVVWTRRFQAVK